MCSKIPRGGVLLELKKINGFDVVGEGLTYEVGGGSGATLFLFEKDGIRCGEIDYSENLVEIARGVLQTNDIECGEAIDLKIFPQYDAVLSNSVFSYFPSEEYALQVLEKMYLKARRSIGIIDVHDRDKEMEFIEYRKKMIENYEERYKGLHKLFYSREFFRNFAKNHNMKVVFKESNIPGYWNNEFIFNCYFTKYDELNE